MAPSLPMLGSESNPRSPTQTMTSATIFLFERRINRFDITHTPSDEGF
jgi:hypothetical protein